MRTQHLREFVTLATYGNFHVAAERLFVSQPTLSNHIKALETELGFELFDRRMDNRLTAAGALFLDGVQAALAALDESVESCRRLPSAGRGTGDAVRIAIHVSLLPISALLEKRFAGQYEFSPYDMRKSQLSGFVLGNTDVACACDPERFPALKAQMEELGLVSASLGSERCAIVMRAGNPIARAAEGRGGRLVTDDFRGAKAAVLSVADFGCWKTLFLDSLDGKTDMTFSAFPVNTPEELRSFDLCDMVLLAPEYMVREFFLCRDDYIAFDAVDGKELRMPQSVVWRSDDKNPLVGQVVEALREAFAVEEER